VDGRTVNGVGDEFKSNLQTMMESAVGLVVPSAWSRQIVLLARQGTFFGAQSWELQRLIWIEHQRDDKHHHQKRSVWYNRMYKVLLCLLITIIHPSIHPP